VKESDQTPGDVNERLDPKLHSNLGKLGWRMPQTAAEVRAAEEWVDKSPRELPERLGAAPDVDRSAGDPPSAGSILSRYLREDGPSKSAPDDARSSDHKEPDLEPER
jgi:hypothetical protein